MEELIQNFHNLGGSKTSEHKKHFNAYKLKLLNSGKCLNELVSKIAPKTRLEEIFKIKLMQEQKMHRDLYQVLKTGDKINCSVVFKNPEFLKVLDGVTGIDFVDKHCPELSFVNRVRVVNKLALGVDDLVGRDYFENVKRKYGLKIATPLLYACDEDFVKEILIKYDLKLNQTLIIRLHKKFPDFLHFYYALHKDEFENHTKVAKYLVCNELQKYYSLLVYGSPHLGKRCLKKFLLNYKSDVVKYPNLLTKKNKVVLHNLPSADFLVYFEFKLPKSVEDFHLNQELLRILKALPKTRRGVTLFVTFKRKYGFDLHNEPELINADLLQCLSNEDRLRFDLRNYPEMLPVRDSLPKLKELFLSSKNPSKKIEFGNKLLKTCEVNRNNEALLEVLKFFRENFNPIPKECAECLGEMKLEELSEEHWEYINELRQNFEANNRDAWLMNDLLVKAILYQLLNNKDLSDKDIKANYNSTIIFFQNSNCMEKHAQQYKRYLIKLCETLPRIFEGEELHNNTNDLLSNICNFNNKNPKSTIHHKHYLQHLKKLIELSGETKYVHYLYYASELLIAKWSDLAGNEDILEAFAKVAHKSYSNNLYLWFLKNRPDLLQENSGLFFEAENMGAEVYYEVSKLDFCDLGKILKKAALGKLVDGKCGKDVVCSIKLLSHYGDVDFESLISKYLPDPECEIDATDPTISDLLLVQRAVITSLKHPSPPSKNLDKILYFCKRDYLKYALDPLYYTICYSPESSIKEPLEELLSRAVSVRKHTLHLLTIVGTIDDKLDVLKRFGETESNKSLKCFTFRKLLRGFLEERDGIWFDLLKRNIALLNNDDWTTMDAICGFGKIPKQFYSDYVETVWTQLESSNGDLGRVLGCVGDLNSDVSEWIIRKSLFNSKNNCCAQSACTFTSNYFLNNKNADFNCLNPPRVKTLPERMGLLNSINTFLEFTCLDYVKEIAKATHRKIEILNKLAEMFVDFEFKLMINCTKMFLINAKLICGNEFDEETRELNKDFMEILKQDQEEVMDKEMLIKVKENVNLTAAKTIGLSNIAKDSTKATDDSGFPRKVEIIKTKENIKNSGTEEPMEIYDQATTSPRIARKVDSPRKTIKTKSATTSETIKNFTENRKYTSAEEPMEIDDQPTTNPTPTLNTQFLKILKNFLLFQLDSVLKIYGPDIVPIFAELIQSYLEKIFGAICGNAFHNFMDLIEELLKFDHDADSTNIMVLCIFLIPKRKTKVTRFKIQRGKIIEEIKKSDSDVVRIYLNCFLGICEKTDI